ncbi:MAG: hypothetical protein EP347_01610 [Alphaproteobacteria bacterium]|nr:MAG: hypothetical protein EP347_01610 [Alphaproteobacteria bacterium]
MVHSRKWLARLKFRELFLVVLALTILDFFLPDPIPLLDEALFAFLTLVLGSLKKRIANPESHPKRKALK